MSAPVKVQVIALAAIETAADEIRWRFGLAAGEGMPAYISGIDVMRALQSAHVLKAVTGALRSLLDGDTYQPPAPAPPPEEPKAPKKGTRTVKP